MHEYKLALEVSPVPLLLVSGSGEILLVNREFERLFEYDRGELIGKPVEVLVPEHMRALHPRLRDAYFRVPTKRAMGHGRDLMGVTKSGGTIDLELGLDPVEIDGVGCVLVTAIDIYHRKAMDERLRLTLDASATAMLMVDSHGMIALVNRACLELFGYRESDLVGKSIERLVPDDVRPVHAVYRASFVDDNKKRPMGFGSNLFARHASGREIPVEIALTPVDTPDGRIVVANIVDLTERLRSRKAIAEKAAELEAANVELSHFAYSASHDLKAPLATLAGLLALCLEDIDDGNLDEARESIVNAMEIAGRSARKVESILELARANHVESSFEEFALAPAVRAIWNDLTLGKADAPRLDMAFDEGETIVAARRIVEVILDNLLSNAVRYLDRSKPDNWIRIDLAEKADRLSLLVTDNGIGISPENLSKVFNMFQRLDSRSQDGLGLAMVRKHVEHLGGSVTVTSAEGIETTFRIDLPTSPARQERKAS